MPPPRAFHLLSRWYKPVTEITIGLQQRLPRNDALEKLLGKHAQEHQLTRRSTYSWLGLQTPNLTFIYAAALRLLTRRQLPGPGEMLRRPDIWQNATRGAYTMFIQLPEKLDSKSRS
jgi:hypothetical protein